MRFTYSWLLSFIIFHLKSSFFLLLLFFSLSLFFKWANKLWFFYNRAWYWWKCNNITICSYSKIIKTFRSKKSTLIHFENVIKLPQKWFEKFLTHFSNQFLTKMSNLQCFLFKFNRFFYFTMHVKYNLSFSKFAISGASFLPVTS